MAGFRYRVLDLPAKGVGAFCPTTIPSAQASSWGLVKVDALLSRVPIPAPSPQKTWCVPISADPKTQTSNCSPDVILRDTYTPYADHMGPAADTGIGMAARRFTPMPVPAVTAIYRTIPGMIHPPIAGRKAMAWPRAFQRWPDRTSG